MSHFDAEDWTLLCPFIPKTFAAFIFPYFKKYDSHNMHYSHYICVVFPFENYSSRRITREENKMFFFRIFHSLARMNGNDKWFAFECAHSTRIHIHLVCCARNILDFGSPHLFASWYNIHFLHPKAFEDNITLAHKLKRAFFLSLGRLSRSFAHFMLFSFHTIFFVHSSPFSCWCGCYCCFGCT